MPHENGKLPWFPFYGRDFFEDESVKLMSNAQIGMYLKLLQHQWIEGSIPTCYVAFSDLDLNRETYRPDQAHEELDQVVQWCFPAHPTLPDRLLNPRLEQIRQETLKEINAKRAGGRAGGLASAKLRHSHRLSSTSQSQSQKKSEMKKKMGRTLPDDFTPNQSHAELAQKYQVGLQTQLNKFKDHHTAKGTTFKDWDAAFRNWIRNTPRFQK